MKILVDSNIFLDLFTEDPEWYDWSAEQIQKYADDYTLIINPIIYSEISIGFQKEEELKSALPSFFVQELLSYEAAFLAGKCFLEYRRRGGTKTSPLPDFYIGAHAMMKNMTLLTRDSNRFRGYFPNLQMITPE